MVTNLFFCLWWETYDWIDLKAKLNFSIYILRLNSVIKAAAYWDKTGFDFLIFLWIGFFFISFGLIMSLDKLLLRFELEDCGRKFDENELILKSARLSKLLLICMIVSFALNY